ncbi:MAG: mandelate racemase/muconate lactonizing enzyme family protein [Phycisphaerae bacterium]
MSYAVVKSVRVFPLSIPLKGRVAHAASLRGVSDAIVVAVDLYDTVTGYGETLPRHYVTGESVASVIQTIQETLVPHLVDFHPNSFAEALAFIEALPWHDESGHAIPAARAGVELALLDAVCRFYGRNMDDVVGWMGLAGFGHPGSFRSVRFSGVLASESLAGTIRRMKLLSWWGLRDFKLKVGMPDDDARIAGVCKYLRPDKVRSQTSLRLDANGKWTHDEAVTWFDEHRHAPFFAIEQPMAPRDDDGLVSLHEKTGMKMIHDESLVSLDQARDLIKKNVAHYFNIRLSKCGGMMPALAIAHLARRHNVGIILGCMVGETSILSAAAVRFLQVCPGVKWAEGCYGKWLLTHDVVRKPLRFGYGGRAPGKRLRTHELDVDESRLGQLCEERKEFAL